MTPQTNSTIRVPAEDVIKMASQTIANIHRARTEMLPISLTAFIKNKTPGKIGKFFGRKAPTRTTEEWTKLFMNDIASLNHRCAFVNQELRAQQLTKLATLAKFKGDGFVAMNYQDLEAISSES